MQGGGRGADEALEMVPGNYAGSAVEPSLQPGNCVPSGLENV